MIRLNVVLALAALAAPAAELTDAQKEDFLRTAEIQSIKSLSIGITNSRRATCLKDGFTHDIHVQTIDESKNIFRSANGTELNFRDYYGFNVAAYRLDRLLGLGMVPVSVLRKVNGESAAVTWWVDGFQMLEKDRWQKKIEPPDRDAWNRQMWKARVFNELAYNTDANLGNVVIDDSWKIWLIDYTRAFRIQRQVREPKNLTRIERKLLERLRALNAEGLADGLGAVLSKSELRGLDERRARIVELFDDLIAQKGLGAVVYDDEPVE